MGIVYLAEQTEPIRRRVALKLIKPGMDSRDVLRRFAAERQALALISHPNVAKVFDAGVTEQGRPYFVMEYVPGIRITDYCDLRCLTINERLELFAKVCDAIQHAHQKGVIHRDLKPSNILVASEDGKPVPKVIDFGLVKASGQQLTDASILTQQGIIIGTPEYMSPEQAGTTALDVDARTDIYALGVLLYELVVGALPFDPSSLRRAAVVEMLRIIQEEEPPKLTTRFGSLGENTSDIARRRHTDVRSLARQLRGELEWITMRAMDKDPNRRYPSASELASDVRRHLADEPVQAGPPSQSYRLRKFVRKHRPAVVAASLLLAILLAAVFVISSLYLRSERDRRRAEQEAMRNGLEARSLQAVFLGDADGYEKLSGEAMKQQAVLGKSSPALALSAVNRLALSDLLRDGPFVTVASQGRSLDRQREALRLVERALDEGTPDAARAAILLVDLLEPSEADLLARRVLKLMNGKLPAADENTVAGMEALVQRLEMRAVRPLAAADDEAFEPVYRESLARRGRVLPPNAASLVNTRRALAGVLVRRGQRLVRADEAAAEVVLREALSLLRQSADDPHDRDENPATAAEPIPVVIAKTESELAGSLLKRSRFAEAERLLISAVPVLEYERGSRNASTNTALNRLATLYKTSNRPAAAAAIEARLTDFSVDNASDIGPLRFAENVLYREGGHSTLFKGESVWIFGDTRTTRSQQTIIDARQLTLASAANLDARNGLDFREHVDGFKQPRELLSLTTEEAKFNAAHNTPACIESCGAEWLLAPGALTADSRQDRLLVFYQKILRQQPRPDEHVAASIAVCTAGQFECERSEVRHGYAADALFGPDEPAWGSATLVAIDHLYVFACSARERDTSCLLARVPLSEAMDRTAWQFFAGDGRWSGDWREAQPVLKGGIQWGVLSVHWNPYLDRFIAVSSRVLDTRIQIRTAKRPEGPWSETAEVEIDTLHSGPGWNWTTHAVAHPELARDGGRLEYFTYVRRVGRTAEIRLIEVRFHKKIEEGSRGR